MSGVYGPAGISETQIKAVLNDRAVVVEHVQSVAAGGSMNLAIRMQPGKMMFIENMYASTSVDLVAPLLMKLYADPGDAAGGTPLIVKSRLLGSPLPDGIVSAVDVTLSGSEQLYFQRYFIQRIQASIGYGIQAGTDFILEINNEDNQVSTMDVVVLGYIFDVPVVAP